MTRARGQLTSLLQRANWLDATFAFGCVCPCKCGSEGALMCVLVFLFL